MLFWILLQLRGLEEFVDIDFAKYESKYERLQFEFTRRDFIINHVVINDIFIQF